MKSIQIIVGIMLLVSVFLVDISTAQVQSTKLYSETLLNDSIMGIKITELGNGYYEIQSLSDTSKIDTLLRVDDENHFKEKLKTIFSEIIETDTTDFNKLSNDFFTQLRAYVKTVSGVDGELKELKGQVASLSDSLKKMEPQSIGTLVWVGNAIEFTEASGKNKLLKGFYDKAEEGKGKVRSYISSENCPDNIQKFKPEQAQFNIQKGVIRDIIVEGKMQNDDSANGTSNQQIIQFRNLYPIPLSTAKEIERFNSGRYVLVNKFKKCPGGLNGWESPDSGNTYTKECPIIFRGIDPAMVFRYVRDVIDSGNLIPQDGVYSLPKSTDSTSIKLKKKSFVDNFDARLYSDLTGLQEDNPNGVLQLEIRYHHVLNTKQSVKSPFLKNALFASKITPYVIFPKLQDRFRTLPVDSSTVSRQVISSGDTTSVNLINGMNVNPINVTRFADINLGIDLDVFEYQLPRFKFGIHFDTGIYRTQTDSSSFTLENSAFGFSEVDSLETNLFSDDGLFTYLMPKFNLYFHDSANFSFVFTGGFKYLFSLRDEIDLKNKLIFKTSANINIHTNPENKNQSFFFRATLFNTPNGLDPNNNLTFQVGFQTPITKIFSSVAE